MTIEEANEILVKESLSLTPRNKFKFQGKPIDDAIVTSILGKYNTTIDELRSVLKTNNVVVPEDFRTYRHLSEAEIVAPAFTSDLKWNSADERIFKYFSIAKTGGESGIVLTVTNYEGDYKIIQIGGTALSVLADITQACSELEITNENGVRRSLHDHIQKEYEAVLKEGLAKYKEIEDVVDFGVWASKNIPSLMLNNYKLKHVIEERSVTLEDNKKETVSKVYSLFFSENPFQCIASHYDSLACEPSRISRMPVLYSNDPEEPAINHIDLEAIVDTEGKHPTWDQYMKRYSKEEADVFKAFIWGIFDAKNSGRQLLYIYDPQGFSGKSVLTNAIASVLGEDIVTGLQKDSLNNQFAFSKIWNKRLAIIDDNKNAYLIRSEKMHQILGNGYAEVEKKGKSSFSIKLQTKVIASGNVKLNIDPDATHERTRVIVIEPKLTDEMIKEFAVVDKDGNIVRDMSGNPKFIGDTSFGDRLIDEFKSFLAECRECYARLCPTRSSIILPDEMLEKIYNLSDDIIDTIDEAVEKFLQFEEDEWLRVTEYSKAINQVIDSLSAAGLVKPCDEKKVNYDNISQHIIKKYGIKKTTKRSNGKVFKVYAGVGLVGGQNITRMTVDNTNNAVPDFVKINGFEED